MLTRVRGVLAHPIIISLNLALAPVSVRASLPQDTASANTAWDISKPLTGRVMPCENGKIKSFTCRNVELLSFLPTDSLAGAAGNDLWGWHDSTTQREFVILGARTTAFVEVTDPVRPRYLGFLPPPEAKSRGAQSVKVYKNYAYIAYDQSKAGIQVFDLTQLREVPHPQQFQETARYAKDDVDGAHTITLDPETGFAYLNGSNTCGGSLHMVDVRMPAAPVFAGCYPAGTDADASGTLYVHDAQCVIYHGPDAKYRGEEICVTYTGSGIEIVDVTDKKQPQRISSATYPNIAYAHQGWFTDDQRYIFVDDELDENQALARYFGRGIPGDTSTVQHTRTIGFDLTDLDDPVVLTEFYNTTTDTDHNLYIRSRYMYQGNYGAGLRIIDVVDPKHPKEVGYLSQIGAAWGTYPFLSKNVIAVPTTAGLFLARLQSSPVP